MWFLIPAFLQPIKIRLFDKFAKIDSVQASLIFVWLVEGEEEGVGHAFGRDIGAWAVAGDDGDVAVEDGELGENAFHDEVIIASRVVCAADCAGEEGVTAEQYLFCALKVADASYCMARSLDDFESEGADVDYGAFGYINGFEGLWHRYAEGAGEEFILFEGESVGGVHIYR